MTNSVSNVPSRRPPTTTQPIAWRDSAPAPWASASGTAPSTMAAVVIRIGRKRRLDHRLHLLHAFGPELIGEFDDQDPVLGDQAHQHHETDLAVYVQRPTAI